MCYFSKVRHKFTIECTAYFRNNFLFQSKTFSCRPMNFLISFMEKAKTLESGKKIFRINEEFINKSLQMKSVSNLKHIVKV